VRQWSHAPLLWFLLHEKQQNTASQNRTIFDFSESYQYNIFFLHNHITKQALFNEYQSVIGFPRLKKKDIIIGLAALPCP
jgi:hypothetical protein